MDFHIDQALLSVIAGALSVITGIIATGVKYLFNLQVCLKEMNMKITPVIETVNEFRGTIKALDSSLNEISHRVTVLETIYDKGDSKWQ